MRHLFTYSMLLILCFGCGSGKEFTEQEHQAYRNLQDLVASKSFEIVSTTARPMASAAFGKVANSRILGPGNNASHIDITSNSNRLVVNGDSIRGYLPFFGDQNFGGGYTGNHSGIEFNDVAENYTVTLNDKQHAVDIRFGIADKYRNSDRYDIMITLFPNNRSTIRVQSTTRSSIEYTGWVKATEEAQD